MRGLERLAVQLTEAVRFLHNGTGPYLRLALDLADGACETLMRQECQSVLLWGWAVTHGLDTSKPSRRKQQEIERDFNAKIDFLVAEQRLNADHGRVLRRLHVYRNEAHHRDRIRPATVEGAIRLLLFLAAQMLEDWSPGVHEVVTLDEVPGLRPYIRDTENGEWLWAISREPTPRARVAQQVRGWSGLDTDTGLREVLVEHSRERVRRMMDDAELVAEYLGEYQGQGSSDRSTVIQLARSFAKDGQVEWVEDLTNAQKKQLALADSQDVVWISMGHERIAEATTPLEAFHALADFEDAMEPLETVVGAMAAWVDGYYQHLSDVARGK